MKKLKTISFVSAVPLLLAAGCTNHMKDGSTRYWDHMMGYGYD